MPRIIHARHDRFPLKSPFRISRGVKTEADLITVTITEGAATGRGEGVPYPRYGESVDHALEQIASIQTALADGADRVALLALLPPGAARNAVDCALWDLEAQRAGQDVATLIHAPAPAPRSFDDAAPDNDGRTEN